MTVCLGTSDYQHVFDTIQAHTGLRVHNGRFDEAARVVDDVLASMHPRGVDDLLFALQTSTFTEPLWQKLIQAITVGETYFFRDQGQFDALRWHILPQLIARRQKNGNRQLRLWSAGCASGEEPYSLAILLQELVPKIETWSITILGTDVNRAYLERARRGLYRASSFRNETPEYIQQRWFKVTPDGYQLDQTIRDMVVFFPQNLVNSNCPSSENLTMNMDLIMCRNVSIYFDQATVSEIVGRFYRALNDMGRLIVGHSELSTDMYHEFSMRNYEKVVFYQKITSSKDKQDTLPATSFRAESRPILCPAVAPPPPAEPNPEPSITTEESQVQSLEAVWSQAKEAADREKWEEALECLAQVETEYLFRPEFHYLRGLVQMAAGDAEKALWAWRQAIYCDPMFALAHYSLGELYAHLGEMKFAARHWRQALAAVANLDPQHCLLFAEEITVEMLRGLLAYRFNILLKSDMGEQS
jgi:chemotaxis protein methyltransferase CheR